MADQEEKVARTRLPTAKGLEYNKELTEKDRNFLLKSLDKKSEVLHNIIEQDGLLSDVQETYAKWLGLFENVYTAQEKVVKLCDTSEAEKECKTFDYEIKKYEQLKEKVETYIVKKSAAKQHTEGSLYSEISTSSSRSAAKLKNDQRKAELLIRASAMDEKHKLEKQKLELKLKEEELELKTELNVTKAIEKVIEEDEYLQENFDEVPNHKLTSTPFKERTRANDSLHSAHSENLVEVMKYLNKPKSEIAPFDGDPMNYNRFLRQFESRVVSNTDSYDEKMNFILQYSKGEAHKIALGYSNLRNAEVAYNATLKEFRERYGDPEVVAQAYVKKALEWPIISSDNPSALNDFSIFLSECRYAIENLATKILDYPENLRQIIMKLPYNLHEKWRGVVYELKAKHKSVSFVELVNFMRKEAAKATDPVYGKQVMNKSVKGNKSSDKDKTRKAFAVSANELQTKLCEFCQGKHWLETCEKLMKMSIKDRYDYLRSKGLCFSCLKVGHLKTNCRYKPSCKRCQYTHPTILHIDKNDYANSTSECNPRTTVTFTALTGAGTKHALPIVPVRLKSRKSHRYLETYAFLDSGSTATFCSERAARLLNLNGRKTRINLLTMGQESIKSTYEFTNLELCSIDGSSTLALPPVYLQEKLPVSKEDEVAENHIRKWSHFNRVELQRIDSEVDLLIGVDVPKAMEPWDVVPSRNDSPFAVKTLFGWVINGPLDITQVKTSTCKPVKTNLIRTAPTLEDQIREQFNYEFPERTIDDKQEMSIEDKRFMESVSKSIPRTDKHYVIDLPFKSEEVNLPNNRRQAHQRLLMTKRRFEKDPEFHKEYCTFMDKVINNKYAQRVSEPSNIKEGKVWYIPHHAVVHPKKNKLRVVFDCASRYQSTSLNDQLLQGPNLTNSLLGVLLRFREEKIAIVGDIDSMFYQVRIPKKHRSFQRFLWWKDGNPDKPIIEYEMSVHLFGSTSSPSCASYALRRTVEDPMVMVNEEVVNTVLKNFYVDDCLKSVSSVQRAISLIGDLRNVLQDGGFHISKLISNNKEVMNTIPKANRSKEIKDLDLDHASLPVERTLGMNWCVESDSFNFTVSLKDQPITRRGILSVVSSIFDPLGFLAPLVFRAKIMLQELCQLRLGWDDPIPENYAKAWKQWLDNIVRVKDFKIKRCFKPEGFEIIKRAELHHFADASQSGYGTVSYLVLTNNMNQMHCSFVFGRSRVAPLKKVTVPRLELTAAYVAVRTDKLLRNEIDLKIDNSLFWTDSMSVLRCINNKTSRFHTFVANRLSVIHEGSLPIQWRYINTKLNPADVASRGIPVDKEIWSEKWIKAPKFLLLAKRYWPDSVNLERFSEEQIENDPKVKTATSIVKGYSVVDRFVNYHSSWPNLMRSVGWILRVKDELLRRVRIRQGSVKESDYSTTQELTLKDINKAEKAILSFVQKQCFPEDIASLKKGEIKSSSKLRKLHPIMREGLLCVGGRLQNADISIETKHQIILPKDNHISVLILRQIHCDLKHSGRNHMLAQLRQKYWLISAPSAIRKMISKCITCRRTKFHVGE